MIVIYPMLTSDTVSHNVLPGISKVLERFVIVYRLNDAIKGIKKAKNIKILPIPLNIFSKRVRAMEAAGYDLNADYLMEANGGNKSGYKGGSTTQLPSKIELTMKGKKETGKLSVDHPNRQDLMLEPTYITAQTQSGPTLIGIKVIPFPLKTTKAGLKAADLINSDKDLKLPYAIALGMARGWVQKFWGVWTNTIGQKVPLLARPITGDPKRDIIFASTDFSDNTFVCFDSSDLSESFTQSASNVKKLNYLGWRSFILADNVNKRVSFCMQEFKGLCNILPYQYLFSSLGQTQQKAFEDLEDIKKSSSAFFRKKLVNKNRVIGEQLATGRLNNMMEGTIIEKKSIDYNDYYLQEGLLDFIKSMGSKLVADVKRAASSPDPDKLSAALEKVPDVSLTTIQTNARKQNPNFIKSYNYAKKVIDNSLPPEVNSEVKDGLATAVAIKATSREGDPIENTKEELKSDLPVLMRIVGSAAKTSIWLILWFFVSQVLFSVSFPYTVTVTLIIIAKGIYNHAKKEHKLDQTEKKHKKKMEKMAQQTEKIKAQKSRGPYIGTKVSYNA